MNDMTEGETPTMTVEEVARLLGVSRDAVYDAVARGEIAAIRLGRLIRIPRQPILDSLRMASINYP